jgi:hypothetical protein
MVTGLVCMIITNKPFLKTYFFFNFILCMLHCLCNTTCYNYFCFTFHTLSLMFVCLSYLHYIYCTLYTYVLLSFLAMVCLFALFTLHLLHFVHLCSMSYLSFVCLFALFLLHLHFVHSCLFMYVFMYSLLLY